MSEKLFSALSSPCGPAALQPHGGAAIATSRFLTRVPPRSLLQVQERKQHVGMTREPIREVKLRRKQWAAILFLRWGLPLAAGCALTAVKARHRQRRNANWLLRVSSSLTSEAGLAVMFKSSSSFCAAYGCSQKKRTCHQRHFFRFPKQEDR